MQAKPMHPSYPEIVNRLRRAGGHLQKVIGMIEAERPCPAIAQQLQAVERAIESAKRVLVHEHLDHCLEQALQEQPARVRAQLREFRDMTKYL